MERVEVSSSRRTMPPTYRPCQLGGPKLNASALLASLLEFYRTYPYRLCEWRPGMYSISGALGDWGVPSYFPPIRDRGLFQQLVHRAAHPLCEFGAAISFGKLRIGDFRAEVAPRLPRYSVLLTSNWGRCRNRELFWTPRTLVDTETTGGLMSELWWVYMSGGKKGLHLELAPCNSEIRAPHQVYRLAGLEFGEDRP